MKYTYSKEKLSNGNTINYKEYNGTFYHKNTSNKVVSILDNARESHTRLKIYYGDVKTGRLWGDISNCYIGRSGGKIKIPLEIYNNRSFGGGALLDDCIVKIEFSNKKNGGVLYDITK